MAKLRISDLPEQKKNVTDYIILKKDEKIIQRVTYPFSKEPKENEYPKINTLIYKRDYCFFRSNEREENRIEIDLKKISELFPYLKDSEIKELVEKFLESIVQIDVRKKIV